MTAPQFTPGPWKFLATDEQTHAVVSPEDDADGQWFTAIISCTDDAVEDANARLIAAAPRLYAALDDLANTLILAFPSLADTPNLREARSALAEARGEQ